MLFDYFLPSKMKKKLVSKKPQEKDYSLGSGERQTGKTLEEIRYDHIARYQLIVDTLRDNVSETEQLFGLDAFCATGYGTHMISRQLNCSMLGVDASDEAIEHANRYFSNDRTFFTHKHFPFDLPSSKFDFVACIESVEHVPDFDGLLRTIVKSIKPGGLMFLSAPNEEQLPLESNPMHFHHKHFVLGEIEDILKHCGAMELKSVFSQNLYHVEDRRMVSPLDDADMAMKPGENGQILYFIFQKQ